jgi:hypothetical protein
MQGLDGEQIVEPPQGPAAELSRVRPAGDVLQHLVLGLFLGEARLDHVSETEEADHLPLADHACRTGSSGATVTAATITSLTLRFRAPAP